MGVLNSNKIKIYVDKFLTYTLQKLEDERLQRDIPINTLMDDLDIYPDMIKGFQTALSDGKYDIVQNDIDDIAITNNITIEKDTLEYKELSRELIKAKIKILEIDSKRAKGDYTLYEQFVKNQTIPSNIEDTTTKYTLKPLIDDFIDEYKISNNWTADTLNEYTNSLNLLIDYFSDNEDINNISHKDLINFRNLLLNLPSNRFKYKELQDKSLLELTSLKNKTKYKPISTTTLNKYLSRISSFFEHLVTNSFISNNPATKLRLTKTTKENKDRDAYTQDDIKKLLALDIYNSKLKFTYNTKPHLIFVPLIGLLMGMRLNEICQLYIDDIQQIDGIYCIDINDKLDKRVKYPSSLRLVPIHPLLIKNGFLKYVNSLDKRKNKRVFPQLQFTQSKGYSNAMSKSFQRLNRKHITTNPKKVFHSFRHTFINNLKQAQIPESIISQIVGHKNSSITINRYGKDYDIKLLYKTIQTIDYNIVLNI